MRAARGACSGRFFTGPSGPRGDRVDDEGADIISTLVNNALTVDPLDVDGDGDVDVLSGSHNDANIVLWENDCGTSAPSAAPSGSPAPTKTPDPTTSPAPTPRAAAR